MKAVPENETDREAVKAAGRWYQHKWPKRIIVGVLVSVITGVLYFGWTQVKTATVDVAEGAEKGDQAYQLAEENKNQVEELNTQINNLDHELTERNKIILQKLKALQTSVDRNRTEYEQSIQILRDEVQAIERHHYPNQ